MSPRRIVLICVVATLAQLGGCATVGHSDGQAKSLEISSGIEPTSITRISAGPESYSVTLLVRVPWRTAGARRHRMVAPPQGRYLVFAYEQGYGLVQIDEVRKTSENVPTSPGNPLLESLADGVVQGAAPLIFALAIVTAPIWGPIYLTSRPEGLPTGGYLWLEDAQTGELVAGSLPWN
jgi:hypothetical protein